MEYACDMMLELWTNHFPLNGCIKANPFPSHAALVEHDNSTVSMGTGGLPIAPPFPPIDFERLTSLSCF